MKFNKILTIAILAVCLVSIGFVGAVSADDNSSTDANGNTNSSADNSTTPPITLEEITSISITGITAPAYDATPTVAGISVSPSTVEILSQTWKNQDGSVLSGKFEYDKVYKLELDLMVDEGYTISKATCSANQGTATLSDNKITISFDAIQKPDVEPIVDTFNATPLSGESPLMVEFTYTIKNMDSGDIYLMCGDDQLATATYPSSKISYTFQTYGSYEVTLKAINGDLEGVSTPKTITVTDGGLISNVYLKFAAPSVDATPATSSEVTGDGITCTNIEWATDANFVNKLASGTKFAAKTQYYVKVTLTNASNYHFGTTKPTVYINDINVNNYGNSVVELNGQTLTVIYKNFEPTSSDISSVSANVTAPATGRAPSESVKLGATTYTASSVKWYKDGSTTAMNTTDKFETNTKYKVTIVLEASGSNVFNSSLAKTNAKINGNEPSEFKRDSSTKVTMSYLFPATVTPTGPGITFTMDPTSPKIPSTSNSIAVKFTYTITGDPTSSILDFGDGVQKDLGTQTTGSITHEYTMLGSYTATLTSTNADATTSKQLKFSVTKDSLIAKITASPSSGAAPLKVTLKDASTGTISSRIWDFGDGSGSSTDSSVTHTYEKPGTYTVTLTVSDGKDTSKAISAITVSEAADTESGNKTAVNYEPLMTIGDIEIPSPLDLIAEFIRLFQSMIDFDNYTIFSSSESEEE